MRDFVIRIIINATAIGIAAYLLPGITIFNNDVGTYLLLGLVFGIVNALVKPILTFLTCPFVILTLGLFILVINGAMLMLTATLVGDPFIVDGWGWAIIGGIVISIINMILESLLGVNDDHESNISFERNIPRR